jgi:hypothetical protein
VYCAACTRHPTTRSCQHDGCSANAKWPEDGGGVCGSPSASASSSSPVALRGSKRCLFEPAAAAAASSGVKAALGEPPNIWTGGLRPPLAAAGRAVRAAPLRPPRAAKGCADAGEAAATEEAARSALATEAGASPRHMCPLESIPRASQMVEA